MDLITHAFFALMLAKVLGYTLTELKVEGALQLLFGAALPDVDRLYSYPRKKFGGYVSRTFVQEFPFMSCLLAVACLLSTLNFSTFLFILGLISHIFLDFVTGSTRPFYPLFKRPVNFNLKLKHKILVGALTWAIGLIYLPS